MATKAELQANIEYLESKVTEALLAFDRIKSAIERMGVEVAEGTPVSEYGSLIESISSAEGGGVDYDAAYNDGYNQGYSDGVNGGGGATFTTSFDEENNTLTIVEG